MIDRQSRHCRPAALLLCAISVLTATTSAQEPNAPQPVSPTQVKAAIDKLGDLDYATRTTASRLIRRTPGEQAVPALADAVAEHADGYVRYRSLVLLTGFNDPRTTDSMRASTKSPNDRLRAVAYSFFERHPEPSLMPDLESALEKEQGEFVRPAVVRALAALCAQLERTSAIARNDVLRAGQTLLREVNRGEDFFRGAVIEALGDYKAAYAVDALTTIARLDGPLQDDAVLALGQIGNKRALETLAALQRTVRPATQPSIAASICLLGANCASNKKYLVDTFNFADQNRGHQELLRAAAAGLAALAAAGHDDMVDALFRIGIPATESSTRAPIALALATVALRHSSSVLLILEKHPDRERAVDLLAEGFDMLEEDFDKEAFFAVVRRTYWASREASTSRQLMQTLIAKLDF